MEDNKDYKEMTVEEQLAWITDFSTFDKEKLPTLCALGDAWEACHIKMFEEGLRLFRAFAVCRDFVDKSLMYRDYSRRLDRMKFYIDKIKKELGAGTVIQTKNGEHLAYVPSLQLSSRRRGRPTKAEAEAAGATDNGLEEEKAKAIAALTGSVVVTRTAVQATDAPSAKKEENRKEEDKPAQPDLFAQAISASQGVGRLHIDQIAWLLSPSLQAETKNIQAYRGLAAKESEQAKELAERGVNASIIEPHSQAASENVAKYKAIYADIDRELGTLYLALDMDENYGNYKVQMEKKGSTLTALKDVLRSYYEKMKQEEGWEDKTRKALSEKAAPEPAKENAEEDKPVIDPAVKSARLHSIRTYMLRNDVKLTQARIERMKKNIEEVEALGEDASEFKVILAKAESDLSESNKQEAKEG